MPASVFRPDDVHVEQAGLSTLGPVAHLFEASPEATQHCVYVNGFPLLRVGDEFNHIGASHHAPRLGSAFLNPSGVTAKGQFESTGHDLVRVNGVTVMTLAGKLSTCSDAARQTSCKSSIVLTEPATLTINYSEVLTGNV